ncbi:initiator tRNA phosphoribosyl transferase-domain-containing protein, partial [Hygrophoropsis aurantiaca]
TYLLAPYTQASSYDLPRLTRPLRPVWITPSTSVFPTLPAAPCINGNSDNVDSTNTNVDNSNTNVDSTNTNVDSTNTNVDSTNTNVDNSNTNVDNSNTGTNAQFHPVVCVSASKHAIGTDGLEPERRSAGHAYIQGAGDDHELWGMGLTPALFWRHQEAILHASRAELPALIRALVASASQPAAVPPLSPTLPLPLTPTLPLTPNTNMSNVGGATERISLPPPLLSTTPITHVQNRISIGTNADVPLMAGALNVESSYPGLAFVLLVPPAVEASADAHSTSTSTSTSYPNPTSTSYPNPTSTSNPNPTSTSNPNPTSASNPNPTSTSTSNPHSPNPRVLHLELPGGKKGQLHFLHAVLPRSAPFVRAQLAAGRAVHITCASGADASVGVALAVLAMYFDGRGRFVGGGAGAGAGADKQTINTRLQWIIASRPQANPSRTTLKRVNEFLLSPPNF